MTAHRLLVAELRKLSTTRMPLGFLAVMLLLAATTGLAVAVGTDMDGSKAFIATAADQQSLMAFGANALMLGGLFGAIAAAREHGHGTVIATFLATPRRVRAVAAQLGAVGIGGALLGLAGAGLTIAGVAAALPTTDHTFLVPGADVARVAAASAWSGAAGAVLGAGVGAVVRNTGGAVTGAVLLLIIAPPLLVQLATSTADWVPSTLANVVSGVDVSTGPLAAMAGIALWAAVPALVAAVTVQRRDVV